MESRIRRNGNRRRGKEKKEEDIKNWKEEEKEGKAGRQAECRLYESIFLVSRNTTLHAW
jgi:hypothetical protein